MILENFVSNIKTDSKIVIWGCGNAGKLLFNYINENRKDINIVYFVDTFIVGEFQGIEIIQPQFLKNKKQEFDLVVLATRKYLHAHTVLLEYLECEYLAISDKLEQESRKLFANPNMNKVEKIFLEQEDKDLYNIVCNFRLGGSPKDIQEYAYKRHQVLIEEPIYNFNAQYQEFINKDAIKTVIDGGFYDGIHTFVFKKEFKNLEHIYAFEPIYEIVKNNVFDVLLKEIKELEIVPLGLWDCDTKLSFMLNLAGSHVLQQKQNNIKEDKLVTINVTSISKFKKDRNIEKIDFIKLDIEGAELTVIKACEELILKDRPQIAISIYHSVDDLVEIPLYLHKILKDQKYVFRLGHYSARCWETVLYAIPKELYQF